jgi:3-methyladenine DNA glycosylase Mpg
MKELMNKAISKIDDPDIEKEFEGILETPITDEDVTDHCGKYKDLLNGRFKLTKVLRIERKNDSYDISNKVADFTRETITQLVEKGELDALNLFI